MTTCIAPGCDPPLDPPPTLPPPLHESGGASPYRSEDRVMNINGHEVERVGVWVEVDGEYTGWTGDSEPEYYMIRCVIDWLVGRILLALAQVNG